MSEIKKEMFQVFAAGELEILLQRALESRCLLMDWQGADRKVLEIAAQDLTNWLKYHWNLIGEESNLLAAQKIENVLGTKEFDEEVNVFAGMWANRWRIRVKLVFNQKAKPKTESKPYVRWITSEQKRDLIEAITFELVKRGEICGTNVLACEILHRAEIQLGEKHDVFTLLSTALRLTREVILQAGSLIFLKVDKRYYEHYNST